MKGFQNPIYVTRPLLPDLNLVQKKVKEIWDSKWLTNNGAQHELLERRLTSLLKVPLLSIFNNGTTALMVACQVLKLQGEVITTPFTFAATPHVLAWTGLKPVFCDIDSVTLNIDPDKIEALITADTSAIMPVHVFGNPCVVDKIDAIAKHYGLKVIYDAAHACGVEIGGKGIGDFGDISMFSFHATKLFHTIEGGALASRDLQTKRQIDLMKNFGIRSEEEVLMPGINGKMNEVQAAIGLLVLEMLEDERAKRRVLIERYRSCLMGVDGIILPEEPAGVKSNCQYFVIRVDEKGFGCSRDAVYERFKEFNIYTRKYFHPLCSDFNCYRWLPSASGENLPVAGAVGKEVLSLPLYGELLATDVENICAILKSFGKVRLLKHA